jgi:hypothetical protein
MWQVDNAQYRSFVHYAAVRNNDVIVIGKTAIFEA